MKAISVRQPWAWLIVNGYKDIENRSRATKHRGSILVHAGLKFDLDGYNFVRNSFPEIGMPQPGEFERGGIVGEVEITGCSDSSSSRWFFGKYGYQLVNAKKLPFRPYKGQLGMFNVEFSQLTVKSINRIPKQ